MESLISGFGDVVLYVRVIIAVLLSSVVLVAFVVISGVWSERESTLTIFVHI